MASFLTGEGTAPARRLHHPTSRSTRCCGENSQKVRKEQGKRGKGGKRETQREKERKVAGEEVRLCFLVDAYYLTWPFMLRMEKPRLSHLSDSSSREVL